MWWVKKFRKRKVQSLLIFIVVAMCTTLIAGSMVILTSLNSVYADLAEETNAPDVKVYSRVGFEKDYQTAFEKCDSVSKIVSIEKCSISTLKNGNKEKDVFIDICNYEKEVYQKIRILDGSLADLKEGTCMIAANNASNLDIKVGDTVTSTVDGQQVSYKVAGIYAEIYSAANEYTCDLLVTKLPENVETSMVYAVWLKDNQNVNQLITEYTQDNEGILDGYFRSKADSIVNAELTELILGGILLGISSVVFLAILLILGYIVKNCFRTEKNTIAIYKTMGYTNAQIRKIYITFYLSIISAGSIAGGFFSPVLSSSFTKEVYENIGYQGSKNGLVQIVGCVLLIMLIAYVMLLLETKRIVKLKPVEILNASEDKLGLKKNKNKSGKHISFSPFAMAFRMMKRDKRNTALLILTCIVSLYIVNLSVVCLENIGLIKGETNYYWLGIDEHDITLENLGDKDRFYEICEEIQVDDKVEKVIRKNYDAGFAIPYHQTTSALVFETYENLNCPIVAGRNPKYADEVAVGNIYLKELGIDIGDYLTIQLDATHKEDLLVVGTFQGFYNLGRSVRVLGSLYEEYGVPYEYKQCSLILKNQVDKEAFMELLNTKYKDEIKVTDRLHLYESIMNTVCDPQRAALLPFTVITVVIGALNAFYIIYASNMEKRKKYAIYKSLGYTSAHLLVMNCIYVGVLVVIAMVIAVPAFIFLFPKVMVLAMSAFGFAEYKLTITPMTLLAINGGMLLVFIISAAFAAVDIFKNHIAKLMNE